MRKAVPTIHESADHLKHLFKQERQPAKQQRLHALYLLASGQARYRQEVATLLGVDRNTVGRWLAQYAQGGLAALLDVYVPAGKAPALTPEQLAQLQQALAQPQGFASYGTIRQWIATTLGVSLTYNAVHKLVRYKLRAKLKVPRPTHIKKRRRRRYL
jgi:transposase